jgi:integrase
MASIRKRTWKLRGTGVDGAPVVKERSAWVVDYFDQAGRRRLKTFTTRKEADGWAVTARAEVKAGIHTPASASITVADCGELWLKHCDAEGLEFSTIRARRQHLDLHIVPFIGRDKLSDLTVPGINQLNAKLRDAGRSHVMRRKVLSTLGTMLGFAQSQGLVAQNVCRSVRMKGDDRKTKGPLREGTDFPSKAELKTMIDKAVGRWRPLLITAVFTAMRASELRGLSWPDVDLDAAVIHVRQRADAWGRIGPPKSKAGKRDIPLAPIVVNALRQWRPDCPAGELNLVFPNGAGNVETLPNIWHRFWTPLQVACGVAIEKLGADGKPIADADGKPVMQARYGFHMLRHAAASLFIAHLGWTPKRVQVVMGHSSIRMTYDLYGHLYEDREADREAMKKIEAAVAAA